MSAREDIRDAVADAFVRRRHGDWSATDETAHHARLAADPDYADAVASIGESWDAVQPHAISPELMSMREQALSRARRASTGRWGAPHFAAPQRRLLIAAAAAAVVVIAVALQLSPLGYHPGVHRTDVGELRTLQLEDRSQIVLDADTRIRVDYSDEARSIELLAGQAQFSVSADPRRPFKVRAGDKVVVALGTVFNVEVVGGEVRVATLEGRVVVLPAEQGEPQSAADPRPPGPVPGALELVAGEAAHSAARGPLEPVPASELDAAVAWRQGRLIFRDTPLRRAVERLNRHSLQKFEIEDAALEEMSISGVFVAGDTWAFAEAVQVSLPVRIERRGDDVLRVAWR